MLLEILSSVCLELCEVKLQGRTDSLYLPLEAAEYLVPGQMLSVDGNTACVPICVAPSVEEPQPQPLPSETPRESIYSEPVRGLW
jgi:hypothetical protein